MRGTQHYTDDEVRAIRHTGTAQSWAYHYQRSERSMYLIRSGVSYSHVPDKPTPTSSPNP